MQKQPAWRDLPVMLLTAHSDAKDKAIALRAGGYLKKQINPIIYLRMVTTLVPQGADLCRLRSHFQSPSFRERERNRRRPNPKLPTSIFTQTLWPTGRAKRSRCWQRFFRPPVGQESIAGSTGLVNLCGRRYGARLPCAIVCARGTPTRGPRRRKTLDEGSDQ